MNFAGREKLFGQEKCWWWCWCWCWWFNLAWDGTVERASWMDLCLSIALVEYLHFYLHSTFTLQFAFQIFPSTSML